MQGPKKSGFNVSSAYVLKSDTESSFPVDAYYNNVLRSLLSQWMRITIMYCEYPSTGKEDSMSLFKT